MSSQNKQKTHIVFPYMGCTVTVNGDSAEKVRNEILGKTSHLDIFDEIVVTTPIFEREDGIQVIVPDEPLDFEKLKSNGPATLLKMGYRIWNETATRRLWLIPGTLYNYIPDGYELVDIFEKPLKFEKGKTDNDIRFGVLAYGFMQETPSQSTEENGNWQ